MDNRKKYLEVIDLKKMYILSLVIFILAFNSCNKIDSETEIENAVQNFYKSDYKYQKTVITFENGEKIFINFLESE